MPSKSGGGGEITASVGTVCDSVRTTIGPFGANKLVIQDNGTILLTSNGSKIIDSLSIENPAIKLLKDEVSEFTDTQGDGSSRFVLLVGALLNQAEDLIDQGIHPTTIETGYRYALDSAERELYRSAVPLNQVGAAAVAKTTLTGVQNPLIRDHIADTVTDAVENVRVDTDPKEPTDLQRFDVVTRLGGGQSETELIRGVILDDDPIIENMPRSAEEAGVALLTSNIDVPKLGTEDDRSGVDISLSTETFDDFTELNEHERETFHSQVRHAVNEGCGVVVTSGSIHDRVKTVLGDHGLIGFHRVEDDEFARIARVADCQAVPSLKEVSAETMGRADVAVRRLAGRDMSFIESDAGEPIYTLLCRAPDPRTVEEVEDSVESALRSVASAVETGDVVAAGGAIEMSLSKAVREEARSVSGRDQLAIEAFADALLTVPRTLAANAGADPRETMAQLVVGQQAEDHSIGVDAFTGEVRNLLEDQPAVDPLVVVRSILQAATDLAVKVVRIDEELPAKELDGDEESSNEGEQPLPGAETSS